MDKIVQELVKCHWNSLKKKKNIIGYSGSLKPRIKKGKEISSICSCFRIYVTKKEDKAILSSKDLIPEELAIDGTKVGFKASRINIRTDVVPIGTIKALEVCRTRDRPIKAGCSAMNYLGTACTLGYLAENRKKGEEYFLGIIDNNHCGARENKGKRGEAYVYPSPFDGGTIKDKIAEHWRHVNITFNEFKCPYRNFLHKIKRIFIKPKINEVDASFERITIPLWEVSDEIFKIGKILGKRKGKIGEKVKKAGRTTGLTKDGILLDNDWHGTVQYSRGIAFFGPCILISKEDFSAGGDSSSALILEDNTICGLLFAGSFSHTIGCHIDLVEKHLEVECVV